MRGDLNDQFQRAQSSGFDDNAQQKVILGGALLVLVAFILGIVGVTIFVIKAVDKFIETPATTNITYESGSSYYSSSTESDFVFGVVDETAQTYTSSYSGVSFTPKTEGWTMSGSTTSFTTAATIKDFSATGPSTLGSPMVTINFESKRLKGVESAEDGLDATYSLINSSEGLALVEDNAVAKWGGNKFTGVIYQHTKYSSFTEVLCADVGNYIMKISITADSQDELAVVRSYFS